MMTMMKKKSVPPLRRHPLPMDPTTNQTHQTRRHRLYLSNTDSRRGTMNTDVV